MDLYSTDDLDDNDSTRLSHTGDSERWFDVELRVGDKVGDYEILELIGEGGMGYVYRAIHPILQKVYALKTVKASMLTETVWRRLQIEAQAIARMNHPNIVGIHNFGLHDDRPFFVMDLLDGMSLADRLRKRGPLPWAEAIELFTEVCKGLEYAHRKGIIHRDIKPGNIILLKRTDASGARVKIVDFGIAKLAGAADPQNQNLTSAGEVFGSPLYMSPEQCQGGRIDARSDIYSIGCTLFETITGQPPFRGKTSVQTVLQHQSKKAPALSSILPDAEIPDTLEALMAKMLAKKPMERYQSLGDVIEQLKTIAAGNDQAAEKDHTARNLALIILATALVATIAGFITYSALTAKSARDIEAENIRAAKQKIKRITALPKQKFLPHICKIETVNGKKYKVFTFPRGQSTGRIGTVDEMHWGKAWGPVAFPADAKIVFLADSYAMSNLDLFQSFKNGDLYAITLGSQAYGEMPKEDSLIVEATPKGIDSDIPAALRAIKHLDQLKELTVDICPQFKDADVALLDQFPHLNKLSLPLSGITGNGLKKLKIIKTLHRLNLTSCENLSPFFAAMNRTSNLTEFVADHLPANLLTSDLDAIASWNNLESLQLNDNKINNDDLAKLVPLKRLRLLSVTNGVVDCGAVEALSKFPALTSVNLTGSHWNSACTWALHKLRPKLEITEKRRYVGPGE